MTHVPRITTFCLSLLVITAAFAQDASRKAQKLLVLDRPLVIAHRGYSAIAPENTLPAFELALMASADLVELDYYHSKDGALVVFHDATLDRTTDATQRWAGAKIRLDSKTADELRSLDAGRWFDSRFAGVRLPLLTESLDLIQTNSVTLIERKAGDAAACLKLLSERSLINQVIVQAFDWAYLRDFHALEPEQILGALGPPSTRDGKRLSDDEKKLSPAWIEEAQRTGARIVVWNRQLDAAAVKAVHERGLKLWVYTINDESQARQFLAAGVDGIITDNPAIVWKALNSLRSRFLRLWQPSPG